MRLIHIFLFVVLFSVPGTASVDCIANPPSASIDPSGPDISDYQFEYLVDSQISVETFRLKELGEVLVMFEACNHLVWTVVFISQQPFVAGEIEASRYFRSIQMLRRIPTKEGSRFDEFLRAIPFWQEMHLLQESEKEDSYFSWRRDDSMFTDLLLREMKNENGTKLRIDLNKSL